LTLLAVLLLGEQARQVAIWLKMIRLSGIPIVVTTWNPSLASSSALELALPIAGNRDTPKLPLDKLTVNSNNVFTCVVNLKT